MLEIELLQVALGNRRELSHTPIDSEWDAIYRFAEEQAILGVLFGGVERLPKNQLPNMELLMEWLGQAEYVKTQNELANADCEKVSKLFRDVGFNTSIMKGQGNALLYGDLSLLRNSGDIDLWVNGGFDRVNEFVQSLSPTKEINELEIQLRGVCYTPVEVHYRPFIMRNPWKNKRLQKFFSQEAENCFNNGLYTTVRFNLVHQLAHIRHHLFTTGIGLRQLVDYYFVLKSSKEDKQEIFSIVESLGMGNFAHAMMWIMQEVFGMSKNKLYCTPNERDGRFLLQTIMNSGNFGRKDNNYSKIINIPIIGGIWLIFVRNLKLWRFDRTEFIFGPAWRIYHRIWRIIKGYK